MSSRPAFDPARLDVAAFAAGRGSLDGSWPLRSLARLAESTVPLADGGEDPVRWKAEGTLAPLLGRGPAAGAADRRRCRRRPRVPALPAAHGRAACGSTGGSSSSPARTPPPASTPRATTTCWRWSRRSTCASLVEDELLLALPLVPRHEVCPEPLPIEPEAEAPASAHPFAALAALKRGPGSS